VRARNEGSTVQVDSTKTRVDSAYGFRVSALETRISLTAFNICFLFQLAPLHEGAARLGVALGVIQPAGAAGAGLKRAALKTPVPQKKTSQFKGVYWDKKKNKWRAECKGNSLRSHVTEDEAAQAYNVEAARVALTLNVIPTAGAAGAGPQRVALEAPAGAYMITLVHFLAQRKRFLWDRGCI